jgi:hypothetical protein
LIRKGQLPPELREIAAYNASFQYWNSRGEPEKANRMAWAMLGAAKRAASQYGAVALAIDDPKKRAEVIAKGYNELVPDGNTMKITGSSPKGVKFEMLDPKGNVTEQGALAMDDMVQLATGMVNGTQWLQSMTGFATAGQTNAEKALEKRSQARAAFEGASTDDKDYVNTLDDEARAKYLAMDPRDRSEFAKRHQQRSEQERKQGNFETRLAVGAENMDRKEANDLAKTAIRLGMWEETRNQVMTMHEQKLAQLQAQEKGRNTRFGESMAARRQRQQEVDLNILGKRTKTTDGAGVKLTQQQKRANEQESALDQQESAITLDAPEVTDTEGGFARERLSRDRQARVGEQLAPIQAQRGFEAERRSQKEMGDVSKPDLDATRLAVTAWRDAANADLAKNGKPAMPAPKTAELDTLSNLSAGIVSANRVSSDEAIRIAHLASDRRVPVRMVQDPRDPRAARVQIGNERPVRLSSDDLNLIAYARGGALNPQAPTGFDSPNPQPGGIITRTAPATPRAVTARPGMTGNPTVPGYRGSYQRAIRLDGG